MDTETLVENLIEDGQRLVEELPKGGFEMTATFWLNASADGKWRFYIVSPAVDADGLAAAYGQLHPLVRAMRKPSGIDPLEIELIGPSDPMARDVLASHHRTPVLPGSPVRWPGTVLGNVSVDGAYFYPLPVTTP